MALNEIDAWQTKAKSISERMKFMLNNPLMSDISFSTRDTSGKQVVYSAHKFVLATCSPVFFAMFYGEFSETKAQIDLPDCESQSFLEFLRFIYCDKSNFTGNCVMQVYYLAKKYIVPQLQNACVTFLKENLSPVNVFDILPQALKFEDEELVSWCWEIVDSCTDEAIKSESFLSISKELLNRVLERDTLTVYEIDLFKAVNGWAASECERQGIEPSKINNRRVTGQDAIKRIRFPLMTQKQFAECVPHSGLLSKDDIINLFMWFNFVTVSLDYVKRPRKQRVSPVLRCKRFQEIAHGWSYSRSNAPDEVIFMTDTPILIAGIRLFGSEGRKYEVLLKIFSESEGSKQISSLEGSYETDTEQSDSYCGYDVILDTSVPLEKNKRYKISVVIRGASSSYGISGLSSLESDGVMFTIVDHDSPNGTCASHGQVAEVLFIKTV